MDGSESYCSWRRPIDAKKWPTSPQNFHGKFYGPLEKQVNRSQDVHTVDSKARLNALCFCTAVRISPGTDSGLFPHEERRSFAGEERLSFLMQRGLDIKDLSESRTNQECPK